MGSSELAKKTVKVLQEFIDKSSWNTAKELIFLVRRAAKQLESVHPGEFIVGNMARRILRLIREAYSQCATKDSKNNNVDILKRDYATASAAAAAGDNFTGISTSHERLNGGKSAFE